MNLIQAWKENPKERWTCDGVIISFDKSSTFEELIGKLYGDKILLTDNWEIAKGKEKVVIEGVKFYNEAHRPYFFLESLEDRNKLQIVHGRIVRVTLEWKD